MEAFVEVLRDKAGMANNKALVFSTFRHTLAYVEGHVSGAGLRCGLVHGGVADEARADLRRRFALPKEDPEALDILLSSEVSSEGLDFQFCDLLINYDLPWNPMRVEQRIGRIDRHGQQNESVAIVNLVTPGTVDADIYYRCLWRIGVFHHTVGGSEEILGEVTRELQGIAEGFTLTPEERAGRLQQLGDNAIRQIQEESALEEAQAELFGLTVPARSWREEIEGAGNFWLSPEALRRCVSAYLSGLTEAGSGFFLGEKAPKTLRLNQGVRARLQDDFADLPRSIDPVARQWEKWLKGTDPRLSVTFDQEDATGRPEAIHLNVLHPLVRQAARNRERSEVAHVSLTASSGSLPAGEYPFALYRWRKVGIRTDTMLVPVAAEAALDGHLMSLLAEAEDAHDETAVDGAALNEIDRRHHGEWSAARTDHMAENREIVQHRLQSLNVSHQARCRLLEDQIGRATNERIRRMKKAELERATYDYDKRVAELERAGDRADIHATQVVAGMFEVTRRGTK